MTQTREGSIEGGAGLKDLSGEAVPVGWPPLPHAERPGLPNLSYHAVEAPVTE